MRHEDTVAVTAEGCENLCPKWSSTPKTSSTGDSRRKPRRPTARRGPPEAARPATMPASGTSTAGGSAGSAASPSTSSLTVTAAGESKQGRRARHVESHHQFIFSIVIPTYRRHGALSACLESLTRLDYVRSRFEVIVVSDGDEDPPRAIVDAFRDRLEVPAPEDRGREPARRVLRGRARADRSRRPQRGRVVLRRDVRRVADVALGRVADARPRGSDRVARPGAAPARRAGGRGRGERRGRDKPRAGAGQCAARFTTSPIVAPFGRV